VALMNSTLDFETRYSIWEQIQALIWEDVPFIKIGNAFFLDIISTRVKSSDHPIMLIPYFWNMWLE